MTLADADLKLIDGFCQLLQIMIDAEKDINFGLYRAENDWLQDFIDDACETGANLEEKFSDLYGSYRQWAKNNGRRLRSSKTFSTTLEHKGFEKRKSNGSVILSGIKLKFHFPEG